MTDTPKMYSSFVITHDICETEIVVEILRFHLHFKIYLFKAYPHKPKIVLILFEILPFVEGLTRIRLYSLSKYLV